MRGTAELGCAALTLRPSLLSVRTGGAFPCHMPAGSMPACAVPLPIRASQSGLPDQLVGRNVEASAQFSDSAKADRRTGFHSLDCRDRKADVAPFAVVSEILLAHQARMAKLADHSSVECHSLPTRRTGADNWRRALKSRFQASGSGGGGSGGNAASGDAALAAQGGWHVERVIGHGRAPEESDGSCGCPQPRRRGGKLCTTGVLDTFRNSYGFILLIYMSFRRWRFAWGGMAAAVPACSGYVKAINRNNGLSSSFTMPTR